MRDRPVFKMRTYLCVCGATTEALRWSDAPAPVCACGQAMHEGARGSGRTLQIITDDVPGGFTVENGFATPQTFYSKSSHRRALDARNLRIADRGEFRT